MFNRLVWRYERRRSYAITGQHRLLPAAGAIGTRCTLALLTIPKSFDDAVWSLWSWLAVLEGATRPVVFVDGAVTAAMRADAARLFPAVEVVELGAWLAGQSFGPGMMRFIATHTLGKKLAMVLALNRNGPVLYSDSDVIAFNRPDELLAAIADGRACYLQEESAGVYDAGVLASAAALGWSAVASLNSGMMHLPEGALDCARAEAVMARFTAIPQAEQSWFSEQTMFAVLMAQLPAEALPRTAYVVSNRRQFISERDCDYREVKVRHFTGTVRHVMYLKGLPFLLSRARRA